MRMCILWYMRSIHGEKSRRKTAHDRRKKRNERSESNTKHNNNINNLVHVNIHFSVLLVLLRSGRNKKNEKKKRKWAKHELGEREKVRVDHTDEMWFVISHPSHENYDSWNYARHFSRCFVSLLPLYLSVSVFLSSTRNVLSFAWPKQLLPLLRCHHWTCVQMMPMISKFFLSLPFVPRGVNGIDLTRVLLFEIQTAEKGDVQWKKVSILASRMPFVLIQLFYSIETYKNKIEKKTKTLWKLKAHNKRWEPLRHEIQSTPNPKWSTSVSQLSQCVPLDFLRIRSYISQRTHIPSFTPIPSLRPMNENATFN